MENSINQQVGERIAAIRNQLKMTQAELAEEMSVRLGREIRPLTVTRLEGGKRPIGVDELVAAAAALRIPAADLVGPSDLPTAFLRINAAGKEASRAAWGLKQAVRQWIQAREQLNRIALDYSVESLPVITRDEVEKLLGTTVEELVRDAMGELSDGADEVSP